MKHMRILHKLDATPTSKLKHVLRRVFLIRSYEAISNWEIMENNLNNFVICMHYNY